MAITNLFSKRQKQFRGEIFDVYFYDNLPQQLRVQIVHIWSEIILQQIETEIYNYIVNILRKEYGVLYLHSMRNNSQNELINFFLNEQDFEKVLDVIELSFQYIEVYNREQYYAYKKIPNNVLFEAIEELNARFKEHGVGYQYVNGQIIRIDSELIHSEVVKPALRLLSQECYAGAQQEFLTAHEHYRHKRYKEAINECLKSFESVMKAICEKRSWKYEKSSTSNSLINICFDNGLIPDYWKQHYSSLKSLLSSGIPTVRNKTSAHGQGETPMEVPDYLVSYILHSTATTIVFLAEAESKLEKTN